MLYFTCLELHAFCVEKSSKGNHCSVTTFNACIDFSFAKHSPNSNIKNEQNGCIYSCDSFQKFYDHLSKQKYAQMWSGKNWLNQHAKMPKIGCFISDKFSNFEKLTWIGVSKTLKTILIFFLIFKFKFRGLPLKKAWKKTYFAASLLSAPILFWIF